MRVLCLRGAEACCKGSRVRLFYFFFITFSMCREMHAALLGATCKVGLSVCTVRAAPQLREILPAARCSNFAWFFCVSHSLIDLSASACGVRDSSFMFAGARLVRGRGTCVGDPGRGVAVIRSRLQQCC